MDLKETARVLDMIVTHYWATDRGVRERNLGLMASTWQMVLADTSMSSIESALRWWFTHEKWPPQASELRQRALQIEREERRAREDAETLARYRDWTPALVGPAMEPLAERRRRLRGMVGQQEQEALP